MSNSKKEEPLIHFSFLLSSRYPPPRWSAPDLEACGPLQAANPIERHDVPEQLAKNGESATNQPGGYFAASFLIVFIPRKVARSLRAFSKALLEKVDSLCFLRQSQ